MAGLFGLFGGGGYKPLGEAPYGDQSASFSNNEFLLGELQKQKNAITPTGDESLTAASRNLNAAAQYDLGILSGDREKVLEAEAPEVSSLLKSYDTARKAAAELTPRGGGRSATLNELPYREAGDVNKLIQQARPKAAEDLTRTASAQGYLGATIESQAAADINSSLSFLLGKAGVQLDTQKLQGEQGLALGQSIGQIAALLLAQYSGGAGAGAAAGAAAAGG